MKFPIHSPEIIIVSGKMVLFKPSSVIQIMSALSTRIFSLEQCLGYCDGKQLNSLCLQLENFCEWSNSWSSLLYESSVPLIKTIPNVPNLIICSLQFWTHKIYSFFLLSLRLLVLVVAVC